MLLYHASKEEVRYPEVRKGRFTKDFSWGFYCTKLKKQVIRWANRGAGDPKVNAYEFTPIKEWSLDWRIIKQFCKITIPLGLESSIIAIGVVSIQFAVNSLGTIYMAAISVANKVSVILYCVINAIAPAMLTYSWQNTGARNMDRLHKGMKSGLVIAIGYALFSLIVVYTHGYDLLHLVIDSSQTEVVNNAYKFLFANVSCYSIYSIAKVFRSMVQGMGYTKVNTISGMLDMIGRVGTTFLLIPIFGFTAVCYSNPITWALTGLFLVPMYYIMWNRLVSIHE